VSTNLASVRSWAGVAALAGHLPTRQGIADGVVDALRFLVAAVGEPCRPAC
jgi:hypothetical protein